MGRGGVKEAEGSVVAMAADMVEGTEEVQVVAMMAAGVAMAAEAGEMAEATTVAAKMTVADVEMVERREAEMEAQRMNNAKFELQLGSYSE